MKRSDEGFLASIVLMGTTMGVLGTYTNDGSMRVMTYVCLGLTGLCSYITYRKRIPTNIHKPHLNKP